MNAKERCFACGRSLGKSPQLVDTRDGQTVYVGRECFKLVCEAGPEGYQPPNIGPRLWLCEPWPRSWKSPR